MGVPIVNFGFSEEYKEEVFGIRSEEGVEITSPGLANYARSLADLGLEEWLEAHEDVLNAVDEAWGNITDIVGLYELGEFIKEHDVYEKLTEAWLDPGNWIGAGDLMGAGLAISLSESVTMIDIFFNDFFPYLEDKVAKMEDEVEKRLQVKLEKLSEGEGGGSAADDDIEGLEDEAIDEYLDELDPDEIQPNDVPAVADAFNDLAEAVTQFENELQEAEAEIGSDPEAEDLLPRFADLKQKLVQHNSSLDAWAGRADGVFDFN